MGRSTREEIGLSEQRKYRRFTAKRKLEIVIVSLRGDRSIAELCREHQVAESLLRKWRGQALEAVAERFESGQERTLAAEQRRRIAQLVKLRWRRGPRSDRVSCSTPSSAPCGSMAGRWAQAQVLDACARRKSIHPLSRREP
jgi:transposase